ncbi:MAG: hypothetical protein QOJ35_502 [Solirubrobacteraceae bacterium]|nr:hypothetical protein [Solirubrobacteraceae bacterium]
MILAQAQTVAHAAQQAANPVDHLPVWLTFIGAITVAVIAAGTAQWRLREQLRHDREMADLAQLRVLLSEASADLREAEGLRAVAASALLTHGQQVRERDPEAVKAVQAGGRKVTLQSERIGLLVGDDHPVAVAHREVVDFITSALTTLLQADLTEGVDARKEWSALHDNEPMKTARVRFVSEAHRLVGSRVRAGYRSVS